MSTAPWLHLEWHGYIVAADERHVEAEIVRAQGGDQAIARIPRRHFRQHCHGDIRPGMLFKMRLNLTARPRPRLTIIPWRRTWTAEEIAAAEEEARRLHAIVKSWS